MEVGLSLGANAGDRKANMAEARKRIVDNAGISLAAQSPLYETEPWGVPDDYRDDMFLNAVLIIETMISVRQLLNLFIFIEQQIGRVPEQAANMPRPMDIDIIYAGQQVINESKIIVPHPRWSERRFVLKPLSDVRPDLILPGQSATVAAILDRLPEDAGRVELFAKTW